MPKWNIVERHYAVRVRCCDRRAALSGEGQRFIIRWDPDFGFKAEVDSAIPSGHARPAHATRLSLARSLRHPESPACVCQRLIASTFFYLSTFFTSHLLKPIKL